MDPIRINRIRLFLKTLVNVLDFVGGLEGNVCLSLVGKGSCSPLKPKVIRSIMLIKAIVASIDAVIETRQLNLAVCKL